MTAAERLTATRSDHWRLTEAGWSYRDSAGGGRIVYRDPETRHWYPAKEAIAILDARRPASRRASVIEVGS